MAGYSITLAGQDITSTVDWTSIQIQSALAQGPGVINKTSGRAAQATFNTHLGPAASAYGAGQTLPGSGGPFLVRGGEVVIKDNNGVAVFGGFVAKLDDITTRTVIKTEVTCYDYWQYLNTIILNQVYTGVTDVGIIQAIMSTYAPSVGLGGVNTSVANYTFAKLFLRAKTVQEALQRVADATGFDVWVDANKQLHYVSPTNEGTAAFAVSDSPDYATSFPAQVTKFETDDTAIINRVYFYGGKVPSADFTQDLSTQANGTNTTFLLAYYPRPSSTGFIQVTVNGVAQAVGYVLSTGAANTLKSQGGTADVLVNSSAQNLTFSTAPASGATVNCTYRYQNPLLVQFSSNESYAYFGRYYDGKIADNTVFDTATAIMRCRTLILEQAYGLVSIELLLYTPGLVAGTNLRIDNSVRNIHNTYIIQQVTAQGLGSGQFSYTVELGAWNWQLVDFLVASAAYYIPDDQSNEEDTTIIQAQQQDFSLLMGLAVTSSSRTSGGYYARTAPVGDGHDAYAGLFTITS